MGNLKGWGSYSEDAAKQESQAAKDEMSRDKIASPKKEGRSKYRIFSLPDEDGICVRAHRHFIEFPGMEQALRFNCPRVPTKGQRACSFCKKGFELMQSGDKGQEKMGKDILPRFQAYYRGIDRENEAAGVQVIRFGRTVYDQLQALRNDPDDPIDFTDANEGYDIWVTREGTGRYDTEYTVRLASHSSPITDDEELAAKWLEQAKAIDLARYARIPNDEELQQLLADAKSGKGTRSGTDRQMTSGESSGDADRGERRRDANDDFDATKSQGGGDDIPF